MQFVYHLCAADFRGRTLYPLDELRSILPDVYERERMKYAGREAVLRFIVPTLGVTWGATVNLSGLDPRLLVAARQKLGVPFSNLLQRRLLRIPVERLARLPAVRYNSATHWINSLPSDTTAMLAPPTREFSVFDPDTYEETTCVPALHLDYLQRQLASGKPALGFVFVPHILVASPIDVSGLETVALTEP